MQTKEKISAAVKSAVESAMQDGALKFSDALPDVALEVPPKKEFGDFATNFAMQTAKIFRTSPRKIAEEIKSRISSDLFDRIEIAGAGFMNFYLRGDVIYRQLKEIYDAGENFGNIFGEVSFIPARLLTVKNKCALIGVKRMWRNWQTRRT